VTANLDSSLFDKQMPGSGGDIGFPPANLGYNIVKALENTWTKAE